MPAEAALTAAGWGASLRLRCERQAEEHALQPGGCAGGAALCQLRCLGAGFCYVLRLGTVDIG